jgi:hypothetical protein
MNSPFAFETAPRLLTRSRANLDSLAFWDVRFVRDRFAFRTCVCPYHRSGALALKAGRSFHVPRPRDD